MQADATSWMNSFGGIDISAFPLDRLDDHAGGIRDACIRSIEYIVRILAACGLALRILQSNKTSVAVSIREVINIRDEWLITFPVMGRHSSCQ